MTKKKHAAKKEPPREAAAEGFRGHTNLSTEEMAASGDWTMLTQRQEHAESAGSDRAASDIEAPLFASAEESSQVLQAACREVVLAAARAGAPLEELAPRCHRLYGRGAFSVHFAGLAEAAAGRALTVDAWLEGCARRSPVGATLPADMPLPDKVLEAVRAFACDCPDGAVSARVIYRREERLLEQLPEGSGRSESREALQSYDPATELCVCGEAAAGERDSVFTLVAKFPLSLLAERQLDQRKLWDDARAQASRLKELGNSELKVGAELAEESYREALRAMEQASLEDGPLEIALRLNHAEALARLERWCESEAECARALELDPGNAKALFRRGRARLRQGDGEGATEDLVKAALAEPKDRSIRELLSAARRLAAHPWEAAAVREEVAKRQAALEQGQAPWRWRFLMLLLAALAALLFRRLRARGAGGRLALP